MTTTTTTAVIASMFKHLTQSYSADEAREILIQKYPESEGDINALQVETATAEAVADAIETQTEKLAAAVKQKTAKAKPAKVAKAPKAPKAPKVKKVTKMDQARELYAAASDKSRKAMIEVFGKELGLSAAAASTYFYTVKG